MLFCTQDLTGSHIMRCRMFPCLELPATGLGTAQLLAPPTEMVPLASDVHTDNQLTGSRCVCSHITSMCVCSHRPANLTFLRLRLRLPRCVQIKLTSASDAYCSCLNSRSADLLVHGECVRGTLTITRFSNCSSAECVCGTPTISSLRSFFIRNTHI